MKTAVRLTEISQPQDQEGRGKMEAGFEACGRLAGFSPLEHFLCCCHRTVLTRNNNWGKNEIPS